MKLHTHHQADSIPTSTTPELLAAARDWAADCLWLDMGEDDIRHLDEVTIIKGVDRNYDGGWNQFVKDALDEQGGYNG